MEQGPPGLNRVFDSIGAEHQIDGHFLYQGRVRAWALDRLERQPDDRDALWSLALLATLRNRPAEAQGWFARLQALEPDNPWPVAYRATVQLAAWTPWQAERTIAEAPLAVRQEAGGARSGGSVPSAVGPSPGDRIAAKQPAGGD